MLKLYLYMQGSNDSSSKKDSKSILEPMLEFMIRKLAKNKTQSSQ